jgi:uncharacterized protein YyaL (SSP411 family)
MISSLAKASSALDDPKFFSIASRAVSFILKEMSKKDGSLYRTHRTGQSHIDAFAEDYAFFGNSLVDMYESSFDSSYLKESKRLADILIDNFYEDGCFKQSLSKNIVINIKNGMDNATPSFIFVSCLFLSRLSYYYDSNEYRDIVEKTLVSLISIKTLTKKNPLFNGANENKMEDYFNYLTGLNYKPSKKRNLVNQIYILRNKKALVFFDIGAPPNKKNSSCYQCGPLSFEFFSNDNKIDNNQNGKYDNTNNKVTTHNKSTKSFDHSACGTRTFMSGRKYEPRRS